MTGVAAFRSEGSWSSGRYYPLVIVEDLEKGCSYFMEHEGGHTWELTVGKLGDTVTLECNSADINHDGWSVTLAPGEEYTTTCAVYGMVQGGFEEAVRELTEYKRQTSHVGWKNGTAPVCFNCYMDCIFGEPNVETLVPLIEAGGQGRMRGVLYRCRLVPSPKQCQLSGRLRRLYSRCGAFWSRRAEGDFRFDTPKRDGPRALV